MRISLLKKKKKKSWNYSKVLIGKEEKRNTMCAPTSPPLTKNVKKGTIGTLREVFGNTSREKSYKKVIFKR